MSSYVQAVVPVLSSGAHTAFRYGMPLLARVRPVALGVAVLFGLFRAFVLFVALIIKAGPKKLFTWKNRKLPSFVNDPSLGIHSTFKTSDGVSLHMVTKGEAGKPVMLFLHGFPENWYSWRAQMQEFSSDYRCVALSLRGYADSDKPQGKDQYTMDKMINDVKETIQFLGVKDVILIGHDLGGLIAYSFASDSPQMVSKLIVLNAPHPKKFARLLFSELDQFWCSWYIYFFQIPVLPEMLLRMGNFLFLDLMFTSLRRSNKMTSEEVELYKFYPSNGSLTPMVNYYRAFFGRASSGSGKITMPTLVIWGEKDVALTPLCLEGNEEWIENLTIVKIEHATHWVQQHQPDTVNNTIKSFL